MSETIEQALAKSNCPTPAQFLAGETQLKAGLIQQLNDRRVPWVAAMAAEIISHSKSEKLPDGVTIEEGVKMAADIYAETERQLGGAK